MHTDSTNPGASGPEDSADVVVVGAGLSGLIAATRLAEAKVSFRVLEARPQPGGRMIKLDLSGGAVADLGGQWIGPTQDRIEALRKALKIEKFLSYSDGLTTLVWDKQRYPPFAGSFPPFHGEDPPIDKQDVAAAKQLWDSLEDLAQTVPMDAPWNAPDAARLDRTTVQQWVESRTGSRFAQWMVGMMARIGGSGAFEPGAASILHMAWTQHMGPQSESPEESLLYGGAGQVPPLLVKQLDAANLRFSEPVTEIAQSGSTATVRTTRGTYQCRKVIVAIPPPLVAKLNFNPGMPTERVELLRNMPMGAIIKVHAIYERPWWRDLSPKLNGTGNGNQPTCEFTADSSLPAGGPGILTSFIAGNRAKEMLAWTEAQRGEAVLADYMAYFGPVAGNPQRYIEKVWPNETWTMGAFTAYPRPGIWTAYGPALRKPFMNVHWAGTETATRWAGYFDGAVRAGEDAARAVLEELGQG